MPSFHSFVGSATAVTMTDDDEFYVRDDSTSSSARLTWSSLKALLSAKYAELTGATFTGDVTVPALTATGAEVQGRIVLTTSGSQGIETKDLTGQRRLLQWWNDLSNRYEWWVYNAAGTQTAVLQLFSETGQLSLVNMPSVTVPTPTGVDQAVRVTAWDAASGRYAVAGPNGTLEQGDTGWRDVSADLTNGFVMNVANRVLALRRTGNVVNLVGRIKAPGSQSAFYTMPTGYRSGLSSAQLEAMGSGMAVNLSGGGGAEILRTDLTSVGVLAVFPAPALNNLIDINVVYTTDEAWPTSLPGTAV